MQLNKHIDWNTANNILHNMANALPYNETAKLYNSVAKIRENLCSDPKDLVNGVFKFIKENY
jgi:hypothetical protein